MAQAGRWIFCPATNRRIGRKVTIADRIRRLIAERDSEKPDLYMVTGFNRPIIPEGYRGKLE